MLGIPAFVAQRIEHLTTDQKVGGSSPSKRTKPEKPSQLLGFSVFSGRPHIWLLSNQDSVPAVIAIPRAAPNSAS